MTGHRLISPVFESTASTLELLINQSALINIGKCSIGADFAILSFAESSLTYRFIQLYKWPDHFTQNLLGFGHSSSVPT